MKTKMNTVSAHLHRTMTNMENVANGDTLCGYASGCLCKLRPSYSPLNNWNHGFVYVRHKDNVNVVRNIMIRNGEYIG